MNVMPEPGDAAPALLAEFLGQVPDGLDDGDALDTLRRLGLAADGAAPPCWAALAHGEWCALLRGLAARSPRLASLLLALRWHTPHAGAEPVAPGRQGPRAATRLLLARAPAEAPAWRFAAHGWIGVAPAAALTVEAHRGGGWLVRVAGDAVDWRHPQAPDEALARWQEVLALAGGIAWTLLDRTAGHAAERPLFGRWLADFPAVQLRLVLLQLRVLVVEESAALLAGTPSAALRAQWRRELDAVRIDAQQLCGGTGYMRETAFADTLLWHEWADTAARQCLCPEQPGPAGGVMHEALRERLRRRLMQACPTEANWAAQWLPA